MTKLAKYLKPFLPGVIVTLALLFVQAMCDLNLPNFMSDIVNVGIQQGGIEHAAPDAISAEGMRLMQTFMDDAEKTLVQAKYALTASADVKKNYPDAKGDLYVNKAKNAAEQASLDEAFSNAAITFVNTLQQMSESGGRDIALSGETTDITQAYAMQPLFDQIPQTVLESARTDSDVNALLAKQSGIYFAKAFYQELGADPSAMQTNYILRVGLYMLLVALLGGAVTILVSLLSTRIASGAAKNLRRDIFGKVESFSHSEFDKFSTASLITRSTNDVMQMQTLVTMGLRMLCYAPIMGIGGIIMALRKSTSMSWIIALAVIVLIGLVIVVVRIAMPKFKIIQKMIDKLNLIAREGLSGLMVIRAFSAQKHEIKRFDEANKDLASTNLFVNRVMVFMMPAITLIMNGVTLLIVWVGAKQIADSALQVGDMMAFMQYSMQIIFSFITMSMMFIMVPRAAVSGERIKEVLETELTITDPAQPKAFDPTKKGVVEFRNVNFRYHSAEEDALSAISFTALPGQTTAIIGATGSGKSTVVNLLMRFYEVSAGAIYVDGVDIREVKQLDLRDKMGYVPQKGVLLSGTVASNIRYGRQEASDEEVKKAAEVAQALDFITEMSDDFQSGIAQGGTNVSGGQKQRLSVARALAKKPEIIIFDDSFSALDFKTDAKLRKALKEHTADSTVIVVAQRVGTIMNAEQIIVLDEGTIVGRGTHAELLKSCPAYYEIASSQLSQEEASV